MWIGLLAVGAVALGGEEARGQGSAGSDRTVLEAFYRATGGPDWTTSTNWATDAPLSDWWGIETNAQGRVETLNLLENNVSGPLPPELSQLTELLHLQLTGNQLSGPIPPQLGQLTNLVDLTLSGNQLNGSIPPELGQLTRLVVLDLDNNQLSGSIPPQLGRLTRLTNLWLALNQLSGPIPVELGNLTALTILTMDSDTGLCVPSEIRNTVFGRLAIDVDTNGVPVCAAVPALPLAAWWALALALAGLGWHRRGRNRPASQPTAS